MRAAQITGPNGPVEIVEREIPEPRGGQVRIRMEACGVCHSDSFMNEGTLPGIQ
jgi:D-arabinose 1-dehydrogenase-like Zn-dependent alcohol dehydrogenase